MSDLGADMDDELVTTTHAPKRKASRAAPPAWHPEATRLRALRMEFSAIARAVGRSESVVREFFNENGERERKREREARWRRSETAAPVIGKEFPGLRAPRKILADPETKRKAFEAFTAGKIDRVALMARITVGTPDTSAELARAGAR